MGVQMPLLDESASKITSEICDDVKGFSNRLFDVLKNTERMEDELNLHRKVKTEVLGLLQEVDALARNCFNMSNGTILCMQEDLMTSRKYAEEGSSAANDTISSRNSETKSHHKREMVLNGKIKELNRKNAKAEVDLTSSLQRERALKIQITNLKKKNASLKTELSLRTKKRDLLSKQKSSAIFEGMLTLDDSDWSTASTPETQRMDNLDALFMQEDGHSLLPKDVRDSSHGELAAVSSENEQDREEDPGIVYEDENLRYLSSDNNQDSGREWSDIFGNLQKGQVNGLSLDESISSMLDQVDD